MPSWLNSPYPSKTRKVASIWKQQVCYLVQICSMDRSPDAKLYLNPSFAVGNCRPDPVLKQWSNLGMGEGCFDGGYSGLIKWLSHQNQVLHWGWGHNRWLLQDEVVSVIVSSCAKKLLISKNRPFIHFVKDTKCSCFLHLDGILILLKYAAERFLQQSLLSNFVSSVSLLNNTLVATPTRSNLLCYWKLQKELNFVGTESFTV